MYINIPERILKESSGKSYCVSHINIPERILKESLV